MSSKHSHSDEDASNAKTETETARKRFINRRRFMAATGVTAGVALAGFGSQSIGAQEEDDDEDEEPQPGDVEYLEEKFPGLEVLSADPENAQAAARETYTDYITPAEELFIRNRYLSPRIDEEDWAIEFRGAGLDEPVEITMEELRHSFSTETVAHTMQCSGNGRAYFDPDVAGNQWTFGALGNSLWTGTPLDEVMEEYGADTSDGMWVMFAGDDAPDEDAQVFARSIPMQKVMEDSILAYRMNGERMTAEHGHPVRLITPGWFGCNNVKWLREMEVMDMMMIGEEWERYLHWQQNSYRIQPAGIETEHHESVEVFDTREQMDLRAEEEHPAAYNYDMLTKSVIGYPGEEMTVSPRTADGRIEIVGVAFAGDDAVESVEVSTDDGDTWNNAELFGPDLNAGSWRQFRYLWNPEEEGEYTLLSRATDEHGRTQPMELASEEETEEMELLTIDEDTFPWEAGGYNNTAIRPHGVDVTVEL